MQFQPLTWLVKQITLKRGEIMFIVSHTKQSQLT